jgi:hypothetical protein
LTFVVAGATPRLAADENIMAVSLERCFQKVARNRLKSCSTQQA